MIYVITVCRNRKEVTSKFINNIFNQDTINNDITLIIVNDGSTDGTDEVINEYQLNNNIVHLKGKGNLWWAGGMSKAYNYLKKQKNIYKNSYLLIANDDIEFDNRFLYNGVSVLKNHKNTILVAKGYDENNRIIDQAFEYNFKTGEVLKKKSGDFNVSSTRAILLEMEDYFNIGNFHPYLLPHYGSDYEWTIRASKKGYKIYSVDDFFYKITEKSGSNSRSSLTLKKLFSKKSNFNPIYRFIFYILVTPIYYLPIVFFHQLKRYFVIYKKRRKN